MREINLHVSGEGAALAGESIHLHRAVEAGVSSMITVSDCAKAGFLVIHVITDLMG